MKFFITSILLLSLCITSFAQGGEGDKYKKGFKKIDWTVGARFSFTGPTITGDSESYDGMNPGVAFGVFFPIYALSKKIEIIGGLDFSMQGSKYKSYQYVPGGGSETNNNARVRLNYIAAPLISRFNWKGGLFAEAGLQPALLISAKDKNDGETDDIKDLYNSFDLGLVAGIGYQTKSKIGFGFRVVPGLLNINKSSGTYEAAKDKNLVFSIGANYRF